MYASHSVGTKVVSTAMRNDIRSEIIVIESDSGVSKTNNFLHVKATWILSNFNCKRLRTDKLLCHARAYPSPASFVKLKIHASEFRFGKREQIEFYFTPKFTSCKSSGSWIGLFSCATLRVPASVYLLIKCDCPLKSNQALRLL